MALLTGSRLGPYEIISLLGAGGMGEVYRAKDIRLGRTVAVKVLPSHLSSDPELKLRLEREARAISALQHANICTLYDIGALEGVDFMVMEYIEGQTVATRLEKGALPMDQVLKVGTEIAQALDIAHRHGIIHRDLKPANIMLTKAGAKLMDFGLAKPGWAKPSLSIASQDIATVTPSTPTMNVASLTSVASPLTQKGSIVGTFQYMPPEVLQGGEADSRSDLFSFGCVLYEMVTGRRAFEGKSQLSVLTAILEKEPDPISVVQPLTSPILEHLIRACLQRPLGPHSNRTRCCNKPAVGRGCRTSRHGKIFSTAIQQSLGRWVRRAFDRIDFTRPLFRLSLGKSHKRAGIVAFRNITSGQIPVGRDWRRRRNAGGFSARRQVGVCRAFQRLQAAVGALADQ